MTGRIRVQLDFPGIEAWMKENLGDVIRQTAESMAGQIRGETTARVSVEHYVTDRPHSTVMVHDAGAAREAKNAHLTRAAVAHGLTVQEPS